MSLKPSTVLHVASEVAPFAKSGGLADVAAALPRAQASPGVRPIVVLPRYRGIDTRIPFTVGRIISASRWK